MPYITRKGLDAISRYKNKGEDHSYLYNYVLSPHFYANVVKLFPMWLAPNTVTISGLVIVLASHAVMAFYSPLFATDAPSWVYWMAAISLFTYQTLDNCDGKQAVRTNNCSPLGHMFDHGCDALNVTITSLTLAAALRVGSGWLVLLVFFAGAIPFFTATWEEYYTGALILREFNGPIEGIFMMITMYMVSAVKGPSFWHQSFPDFFGDASMLAWEGWTLLDGLILFFVLGIVSTVFSNVKLVMEHARSTGSSVMVPMRDLIPVGVVVGCVLLIVSLSPMDVMAVSPRYFLWGVGISFSQLVLTLILAHLTEEKFEHYPTLLLPLVSYTIFVVLCNLTGAGAHIEPGAVLLFLLASVLQYVHMAMGVIGEVTTFLGISCFSVWKKK